LAPKSKSAFFANEGAGTSRFQSFYGGSLPLGTKQATKTPADSIGTVQQKTESWEDPGSMITGFLMPGNLLNISLVRFTVDVLARAGLFDPVSNNQVL
jgi:hypothetical protein